MPKIAEHKFKTNERAGSQYWFWCPGCNEAHAFTVPPWTFNRDFEKPTFTPSLLCNPNHPESRCHLIICDGIIKFCGDCHHVLKNQIVPLPEVPEWLIKYFIS